MSEFILPAFILGLCIGSFLNVVIYRLPRKYSFVFNRSQCPSCTNNLNFFDLIPVLSWIFLKAKCRYCSHPISIRYPLVELMTAIFFSLCLFCTGWIQNFSMGFYGVISGWILVSFLIILTFIDIDYMILPDSITYSGSLVGLILIFCSGYILKTPSYSLLIEHFYSYLLAYFGVYMFSYIVKLLINKPALGAGDAKLFAMSAAWLGFDGLEVTITLSFLLSAVFILFGFIFRFIKRGEYIPFGPFICCSIFFVWFFGSDFWFKSLGDIFWWKYI